MASIFLADSASPTPELSPMYCTHVALALEAALEAPAAAHAVIAAAVHRAAHGAVPSVSWEEHLGLALAEPEGVVYLVSSCTGTALFYTMGI